MKADILTYYRHGVALSTDLMTLAWCDESSYSLDAVFACKEFEPGMQEFVPEGSLNQLRFFKNLV